MSPPPLSLFSSLCDSQTSDWPSCSVFICWLACGLHALGPRCKPGKNISPSYVCFSDQGSWGRQAHGLDGEMLLAARLARGQGGHISFQAWNNYWFKLWSPALSSLMLKPVTPSRKTNRGLRGLAKGASRKWSLVAEIVGWSETQGQSREYHYRAVLLLFLRF